MSAQTLIFRTTIITYTLHLASSTCFFQPIHLTHMATSKTAEANPKLTQWTWVFDNDKLDSNGEPYLVTDLVKVYDTRIENGMMLIVDDPFAINQSTGGYFWAKDNPSAFHSKSREAFDKHKWADWAIAKNAADMTGFWEAEIWLEGQHTGLYKIIEAVITEAREADSPVPGEFFKDIHVNCKTLKYWLDLSENEIMLALYDKRQGKKDRTDARKEVRSVTMGMVWLCKTMLDNALVKKPERMKGVGARLEQHGVNPPDVLNDPTVVKNAYDLLGFHVPSSFGEAPKRDPNMPAPIRPPGLEYE